MSQVALTFPDSTYSTSNKPSVATLKADLTAIETAHNDLDTNAVTATSTTVMTNKTLTAPIITTPTIKTYDGWQSVTDTWTYASADAPTFTITVPTGAASLYGVGMRIKLTQTTPKYFIITAVADTVLTVYGGTDYTLANAAISSIYVSLMKAPLGFPLDPTKWTVRVTNNADQTQSSPTINTWYNIGTTNSQIVLPIGAWNLSYIVNAYSTKAATTQSDIYVTLSTANNTESDTEFTCWSLIGGASATLQFVALCTRRKFLSVASKTTYYLNAKTGNSSMLNIQFLGSSGKTILEAVCAYL